MNIILVAEIGINHSGNLSIAKQLIDAAVLGGCQYVKFQKRTVNAVYTPEELAFPLVSPWGKTTGDQKYGREFDQEQYAEIDRYCKEKNIGWFASPWDPEAVNFLARFKPPYMKIPSALITNIKLLEKVKATGIPVIIATGMSSAEEVDKCVSYLGGNLQYILSCTSSYPTPIKDVNLSKLLTLQKKYSSVKIGYSNHHQGIAFIIAAAVLGAKMIEYHVTLDRASYGTDQASSIEVPGMIKIKEYLTTIEAGWGHGRIECLESELPARARLRR